MCPCMESKPTSFLVSLFLKFSARDILWDERDTIHILLFQFPKCFDVHFSSAVIELTVQVCILIGAFSKCLFSILFVFQFKRSSICGKLSLTSENKTLASHILAISLCS